MMYKIIVKEQRIIIDEVMTLSALRTYQTRTYEKTYYSFLTHAEAKKKYIKLINQGYEQDKVSIIEHIATSEEFTQRVSQHAYIEYEEVLGLSVKTQCSVCDEMTYVYMIRSNTNNDLLYRYCAVCQKNDVGRNVSGLLRPIIVLIREALGLRRLYRQDPRQPRPIGLQRIREASRLQQAIDTYADSIEP